MRKARQVEQPIKKSAPSILMEAFKALKTLPVSTAILNASGTILSVNDTWREFARANGLCLPNEGVGANYLQYCVDAQFRTDLEAFLAGRLDLLTLVYPCHSHSEERWFSLIGVPLSLGKPNGVALLHVNLTAVLPPQFAKQQGETAGRSQMRPGLATITGAIEHSVSETLSSQLNKMFAETRDNGPSHEAEQLPIRLSERQIQVLRLLGRGKTNNEIAQALFRSPNTIKLHVSAILKQLRLKSRTQAALLAAHLPGESSICLPVGSVLKKTRTTQASIAVLDTESAISKADSGTVDVLNSKPWTSASGAKRGRFDVR